MNQQEYMEAANRGFNRYLDPRKAKLGHEVIASMSASDAIINWIRLWKCTNSTILQKLTINLQGRKEAAYLQALKRLKKAGAFHSVRVGAEAFYFHDSYKHHLEKLKEMDPPLRNSYLEKTGIRHHVEVQNVWTWMQIVNARIRGKLFIEGPEDLKSQFRSGISKKPDLALVGNGCVPVEVERNVKSKERWHEKWLEYECDPNVLGCLYFVSDTLTWNTLHENFLEFFEGARKRNSKFWLAQAWPYNPQIVKYSTDEMLEVSLPNVFFDDIAIPVLENLDLDNVPEGELLQTLFGPDILKK